MTENNSANVVGALWGEREQSTCVAQAISYSKGLRVVMILSTYLTSSSFAVSVPLATICSTSGAPESHAKPCICGLP